MPKDILLAPCGDIDLSTGDLQLCEKASHIRQRWLIGIRTYFKEWIRDQEIGIPWMEKVWKKSTTKREIEELFAAYTLAVPGVIRVNNCFVDGYDGAARHLKIKIDATITGPEDISFYFDGTMSYADCQINSAVPVPLQYDGLRVWFDAQDSSSMDVSPINLRMHNKAGEGYAQSMGTVGKALLKGFSTINGHPAVFIDNDVAGNNQYLEIKGTQAIRETGVEGFTAFLVFRRQEQNTPASPDSNGLFSLNGIASGDREHYSIFYDSENFQSTIRWVSEQENGTPSELETDTIVFYNAPEVLCISADFDSGFYDIYRNTQLQINSGSTVKRLLDGDGLIGAAFDNTGVVSSYFNGYFGELLIYAGALSSDAREAVENYLLEKWGATVLEGGDGAGFGFFPPGISAHGL